MEWPKIDLFGSIKKNFKIPDGKDIWGNINIPKDLGGIKGNEFGDVFKSFDISDAADVTSMIDTTHVATGDFPDMNMPSMDELSVSSLTDSNPDTLKGMTGDLGVDLGGVETEEFDVGEDLDSIGAMDLNSTLNDLEDAKDDSEDVNADLDMSEVMSIDISSEMGGIDMSSLDELDMDENDLGLDMDLKQGLTKEGLKNTVVSVFSGIKNQMTIENIASYLSYRATNRSFGSKMGMLRTMKSIGGKAGSMMDIEKNPDDSFSDLLRKTGATGNNELKGLDKLGSSNKQRFTNMDETIIKNMPYLDETSDVPKLYSTDYVAKFIKENQAFKPDFSEDADLMSAGNFMGESGWTELEKGDAAKQVKASSTKRGDFVRSMDSESGVKSTGSHDISALTKSLPVSDSIAGQDFDFSNAFNDMSAYTDISSMDAIENASFTLPGGDAFTSANQSGLHSDYFDKFDLDNLSFGDTQGMNVDDLMGTGFDMDQSSLTTEGLLESSGTNIDDFTNQASDILADSQVEMPDTSGVTFNINLNSAQSATDNTSQMANKLQNASLSPEATSSLTDMNYIFDELNKSAEDGQHATQDDVLKALGQEDFSIDLTDFENEKKAMTYDDFAKELEKIKQEDLDKYEKEI